MTDNITEFLDFLRDIGAAAVNSSDIIITDGKVRRFQIAGDKAGKKNGRYSLWERNGWVINSREGIVHKWSSRVNKKMTDAERREYVRRVEAEKKQREKELKDAQKRAAEKAARLWSKGAKVDSHPYLTKKGISGISCRGLNNALMIPAYKDGRLCTLQFIGADGEKRFLTGGEIQGAYGSIGRDTSHIYVCEGYATSESVHFATGKAAVYAFNAGNLLEVVKALRAKYPDKPITVCADNDQWTTIRGKLVNVGMEKGTEAAIACSGFLAYPDFDADDADKRTDFNDYHAAFGKDAVCARLAAGAMPDVRGDDASVVLAYDVDNIPPPPSYFDDIPANEEYVSRELAEVVEWKDLMICDTRGNIVKNSLKNSILLLHHHDKYKGIFRYDEFAHRIVVAKCPPWESETDFKIHTLSDIDITETAACMEGLGMSPDRTRVHNAIETVAHKNSFHPAREYFDALVWDGVPRLDGWLEFYLGAEEDCAEYLSFVGRKWMTAAVKRVYEPGCKFDHVLVIEGIQGRGKSTALKVLATFGEDEEESYFTDAVTIADIQNKDTIQKIQGSIIVELAELAGFNKKDDEEIKRWITLQHDDCRLPYARTTTRFSRQFVLAATTNGYEYLKDPTGNRRYWPMKSNAIDLDALKKDRVQLWAEAVHLYKSKLYIGPDEKEMELAGAAQKKRLDVDSWEDDVLSALEKLKWKTAVKTGDIMKEMGLAVRDRDERSKRRVASIMRANGYENEVQWIGGRSVRGWLKSNV
jgi:putative DNA primase/helicase